MCYSKSLIYYNRFVFRYTCNIIIIKVIYVPIRRYVDFNTRVHPEAQSKCVQATEGC